MRSVGSDRKGGDHGEKVLRRERGYGKVPERSGFLHRYRTDGVGTAEGISGAAKAGTGENRLFSY